METAKSLKEATETILTGDEFHLNNEGGSIIAEALNKIANQVNPKSTDDDRKTPERQVQVEITSTLPVPKGAVRYIVGKGKKRMKEIEDNCNVTLTISLPKQWSDEQTATITGPEEGVNMAANEVINIVEQYNKDQDKYAKRKRETKDIPCNFYQEGKCKHGNKCDYAHSKRQHSSRSHSPSTHH